MDLGLRDRVAVVTGGSSGIGLATVELLLDEGARVALCARDAARLEREEARLRAAHGDRVLAQRCDVLDEAQLVAFRDAVLQHFGGVDLLINNAGQARVSSFANTSDDDWEAELRLKFFSVVRPTRLFLPALQKSAIASIVCVNSLLAKQPEAHMVATSAARAGAHNLAKSLSVEFAPRIRVNSILLGLVDSGQWQRRYEQNAKPGQSKAEYLGEIAAQRRIPLGRVGVPREPAAAIAFLASPLASYITGAALEVSGGVSRYA